MKEIKLGVAMALLSGLSYGQCEGLEYEFDIQPLDSLKTENKNVVLNKVIDDCKEMIKWIQWDVENGRLYEENAEYYRENLNEIIEKAKSCKE